MRKSMQNMLLVVIPTFNRPDQLLGLLESLGDALFDPQMQIVVVDDGSAADDVSRLRAIESEFGSVKFVFLKGNRGGSAARNAGASIGKGEWTWFIDDDDRVAFPCVRALLAELQNPQVNDLILLRGRNHYQNDRGVYEAIQRGDNLYKNLARYGNKVNTSCAVIRSKLLAEIGGWDEGLIAGQDTDLFLRLSERTDATVLCNCIVDIFHHDTQRITTNPKVQMIAKLQFIKKNWRRLHWLRLARYIATMVLFFPYLRRMTIRGF